MMKDVCYIIVKLLRRGFGVHDGNSLIEAFRILFHFCIDKGKVWNRHGIVCFQSVGIHTNKLGSSRNETEILLSKNYLIYIFPIGQKVMISNNSHIRIFQLLQNITLPQKFFGQSEISKITSMNDKVNIRTIIRMMYKVF